MVASVGKSRSAPLSSCFNGETSPSQLTALEAGFRETDCLGNPSPEHLGCGLGDACCGKGPASVLLGCFVGQKGIRQTSAKLSQMARKVTAENPALNLLPGPWLLHGQGLEQEPNIKLHLLSSPEHPKLDVLA